MSKGRIITGAMDGKDAGQSMARYAALMTRRGWPRGRGSRRRSSSMINELEDLQAFFALNLFSWMRPDSRVDVSGKAKDFLDKVAPGVGARASIDPNHLFNQASAARQGVVAPQAIFAGREAFTFDAAGMGPYASFPSNPAAWAFTANGAGYTSLHIVSFSNLTGNHVVSASSGNADTSGLQIVTSGADLYFAIFQTGADPLPYTKIATGLTVNTPYAILISHGTARSPQVYAKVSGHAAVTAPYAAAPISESATTAQMLANNSSAGAAGLIGMFAEAMYANSFGATLEENIARYVPLRYSGLSV